MSKQVYTWGKVQAGDIISFRYKGKKPTGLLTTVLVLNPKLPHTRKDGTKTFHLNGLKLEERGSIPTIRNKQNVGRLLETLGNIEVVSQEDEIYKVDVPSSGQRGARPASYRSVLRYVRQYNIYRSYDFIEAKKSQVFLEPIKLPKKLVEVLIEN
jgi:hypothetical protein